MVILTDKQNKESVGIYADESSCIDLEGANVSGYDQAFLTQGDSTILIKNTTVDGISAEPEL